MNNDQWNPFLKPSQSLKDEDFEAVACKQCGNAAFDQYYRLYKISALKSPTGKQQIYNVPIFVCANCGFILDPRKDDLSTENPATEQK